MFGILNGDITMAFGSLVMNTDHSLYGLKVSASF